MCTFELKEVKIGFNNEKMKLNPFPLVIKLTGSTFFFFFLKQQHFFRDLEEFTCVPSFALSWGSLTAYSVAHSVLLFVFVFHSRLDSEAGLSFPLDCSNFLLEFSNAGASAAESFWPSPSLGTVLSVNSSATSCSGRKTIAQF